MLKKQLEKDLKNTIGSLGYDDFDIVLSIPENSSFGDYTSNIALQLSNQKSKNANHSPQVIANQILLKFGHPHYLERIEIAGPSFLNFFFKDESLLFLVSNEIKKGKDGKKILVEYASPNLLKPYHIGHLRNLVIGESIARILEFQGNKVFRVSYPSDIGPAISKTIWGIKKSKAEFEKVRELSLTERLDFLGRAYAHGYEAYENKPEVKVEIDAITKQLYAGASGYEVMWKELVKWSEGYLDTVYLRFGTEFDATVHESEVSEAGKNTVLAYLGKVFIEDQGAIIFPGEKFGLHNRVFINSVGNPTYEAKEIALTRREAELFPYDLSLHVVSNEQTEYFKVVTKAIELIDKDLGVRKKHLSYGFVGLTTGKMSSRTGNVLTVDQLLEQVKEKLTQIVEGSHLVTKQKTIDDVAVGAIKFSYLKYSSQKDIAFDIDQSVSLQGDSGPYVQYTYARTQSVISKSSIGNRQSETINDKRETINHKPTLEPEEREILRQLEYFEFITKKAADDLEATGLTTYLLDLAKAFNLFYQRHPILSSEKQAFRLSLTDRVGEILKLGLYLLGIEAPERM